MKSGLIMTIALKYYIKKGAGRSANEQVGAYLNKKHLFLSQLKNRTLQK
jgi:hypothetical protein